MNAVWERALALYRRFREQINYLVVGGLTTLVSLGVYYACAGTFLNPENPLQLQAANVISWICAVAFAYFANRRYVFFSREENRLAEAGKFFLSRLTTLGMEMGVMALGVSVMGLNDRIVKLVTQGIIIVANYVFSKLLVFRRSGKPEEAAKEESKQGIRRDGSKSERG